MDGFRPQRKVEPARRGAAGLERLVRLSLAALIFERGWRVLVGLLTLGGFFLALSWLGLWLELGGLGRMLGVAIFGAAGLWVLARGLASGPLNRVQALERLDAAPGGEHRLASSLDDTLADVGQDPATKMLWALHRRRLEEKLGRIGVALPAPRIPERDPLALRAFALVGMLAAAFVAGPERQARLMAAFDWGAAGGGTNRRVDAWLDPPAYTGRPPIVLSLRNSATDAPSAIAAPVNSILIVRAFGEGGSAAKVNGALAALEPPAQRKNSEEHESKFRLAGDARVTLPGASGAAAFDIVAIADRPPTIELTQEPRNNARGSMTLGYRTDDDYGLSGAEAIMTSPLVAGRPVGRALYPPPRLPLALPPTPGGLGEARATLDLADNPWAGARVILTLAAHDEAGNEGLSAPLETVLPQRRFGKPLARALAEQRRNLALDPDHYERVASALDALSLGAALFQTPSSIYLGLSTAKRQLARSRGDDDLREVADLLWAMALSLEDGDISQAERDLRAAQRELRDALARGAGEEEIARLTEELRNAMDKFLSGLMQGKSPDARRPPAAASERGSRTLTERDLQSMLSEIEKAEKAGDLAQAQRLLDELQDVLENLRPSSAGRADPRAKEMSQALDEIDRLSREQQQLRDDTSKSQQNGAETRRGRGADDESGRDMRSRQQALREKLEQQQNRLRGQGEDAPQDFDDADKAMKEAEKALGPGGEGKNRAVDAQGRALQSLRRGADQLASRMQDGEGGEEGEGGRPGRKHGMSEGESDDPLGRPTGRRRGYDSSSRYDPLGLPPAMRARRVQEELRRRLGQPQRPAEELDYIERLLRR